MIDAILYQIECRVVQFFRELFSNKGVIQMSAEHEDLMVLEEGNSPEAVQACCTSGTAAVR